MCTHLNKTGATYYFRRPVPDDLVGYFTTSTGKPRIEWKFSLRTKDREEAKRRLRPHVAETDRLIDDARLALAASQEPAESGKASSADRERAAAAAAVEAVRQARYEAREEYRIAARQRMLLSTAELSPQEAAWRDLVREQGQDPRNIEKAAAGQRDANDKLGNSRAVKLIDLFNRWAALPGRNVRVTKQWRVYVETLIKFLGHSDASRIGRTDLILWRNHLRDDVVHRGKRLSAKTINDSYLAAVNAVLPVEAGRTQFPVEEINILPLWSCKGGIIGEPLANELAPCSHVAGWLRLISQGVQPDAD